MGLKRRQRKQLASWYGQEYRRRLAAPPLSARHPVVKRLEMGGVLEHKHPLTGKRTPQRALTRMILESRASSARLVESEIKQLNKYAERAPELIEYRPYLEDWNWREVAPARIREKFGRRIEKESHSAVKEFTPHAMSFAVGMQKRRKALEEGGDVLPGFPSISEEAKHFGHGRGKLSDEGFQEWVDRVVRKKETKETADVGGMELILPTDSFYRQIYADRWRKLSDEDSPVFAKMVKSLVDRFGFNLQRYTGKDYLVNRLAGDLKASANSMVENNPKISSSEFGKELEKLLADRFLDALAEEAMHRAQANRLEEHAGKRKPRERFEPEARRARAALRARVDRSELARADQEMTALEDEKKQDKEDRKPTVLPLQLTREGAERELADLEKQLAAERREHEEALRKQTEWNRARVLKGVEEEAARLAEEQQLDARSIPGIIRKMAEKPPSKPPRTVEEMREAILRNRQLQAKVASIASDPRYLSRLLKFASAAKQMPGWQRGEKRVPHDEVFEGLGDAIARSAGGRVMSRQDVMRINSLVWGIASNLHHAIEREADSTTRDDIASPEFRERLQKTVLAVSMDFLSRNLADRAARLIQEQHKPAAARKEVEA